MFTNLIKLGMIASKVLADIQGLQRDISLWLIVHSVNEFTRSKNAQQNGKKYLKSLFAEIEPKIKVINSEIVALNKVSTLFEGNFRLKTIKIDGLKKIVKSRFEIISKDGESKHLDENLDLKINHYFRETREAVANFANAVSSMTKFERSLKKVKPQYKDNLSNAIDIMDMGIYDVSIFTSGRTVEESVNRLLKILISKKKIESFDINKKMLGTKVKILNDNRILTEKTYFDLSSLRVSRNDTGHPNKVKFTKQEASEMITLSISLLCRIEKLITKHSK